MSAPPLHWVGSWATSLQSTEPANQPPAPGLSGNTLRQVIRCSLGGPRARFQFSNLFGSGALTLERVRCALAADGHAIVASSDRALTFSGESSVTIPPGQFVHSDALDFELEAHTRLAVSVHFGLVAEPISGHPGSRTTSYLQAGDAASAPSLDSAVSIDQWYVLSGLEVLPASASAALVALGDSITDGRGSTTNHNDRWTDALSLRLRQHPRTRQVAVLNAGIGGNHVLRGGLGPCARQRFERDVLQAAGARWLLLLEGVNDIGTGEPAVAGELIEAFRRFVGQARQHGLRAYGGTILPFGGSQYDTPTNEQARQLVNEWIRTPGNFDALVDFDAAVRNPHAPHTLVAEYDCGDHLHLSPQGYRAMADAVELSLFY
ncbi:MAG: SGNH/GDSL hydrolase family protein [Polyangiaceae bacterium]